MDKSDEITTRLIAGETEEELTRAGYDQESVSKEQNKIRLIKELTQTADIQAQNNLNIKKLLIYTSHNTIEIAWGTLIGTFGLAAAFRSLGQNGTALFLLFAGPILFMLSSITLIRSIDRLGPPKKTPWFLIVCAAISAPIGLLLFLNGIGGIAGLKFLELLNPLITYPTDSKLWPWVTSVFGLLLLAFYFYVSQKLFGRKPKIISPTIDQTIKHNTSTVLSSSAQSSVFNQPVLFTAVVTPKTASGTVSFYDGSVNFANALLANGSVSVTSSALAVGSRSIVVIYNGDENNHGSTSNTIPQTIKTMDTIISLSSNTNRLVFGDSMTFLVSVTPNTVTGTVTFKDGNKTLGTVPLSNGSARFSIISQTVGSHRITAIYNGDANDNASTSKVVTQTVNKANSSIALNLSAGSVKSGSLVTFTATVSPNTTTGTVTFKDNSTILGTATLTGGQATFKTTKLSVGTHSITAAYGGDGNFNGSTSSVMSQAISKN